MSIKILIAGDLVVDKKMDFSRMDSNLIQKFSESDFNIVNLECPLTKAGNEQKIIKTGPHIKGDISSMKNILEILQIKLVTLANNHILDYGEKGIIDTLNFCKYNGLNYVGGGENLQEAKEVTRIEIKGKTISILNFAENEWSIATENNAGANPLNVIDNCNQIIHEKSKSDFVFVIIHGGHEYYNLPSPRMQKQYRFYADHGADLVVSHHTHCISGFEIYNETPIYYSLGNFLFTWESQYEDWYTGLVLEINIEENKIKTNLLPVHQTPKVFDLGFLKGEEKACLLERIEKYNEIINDPKQLTMHWYLYAKKMEKIYSYYFSPINSIKNKYIKGVLRRLNILLNTQTGLAMKLNLMRCESHSDISQEILSNKLSKNNR